MARPTTSMTLATATIVLLLALAIAPWTADRDCCSDQPCTILQEPGTGNVNVTATDDLGRPLAEVEVAIYGSLFSDTNVTDVNGTARFFDVPVNATGDPYIIFGNHDRYLGDINDSVVVSEFQTTEVLLVLMGGRIVGIVTDTSGRIVNASVSAVSIPPSKLTNLTTNVSQTTGRYSFIGLPGEQSLNVTATAEGFESQWTTVTLDAGEREDVDFRLTPLTGTISGHVYHASSMTPISNASVSIQVGLTILTKKTDLTGYYSIDYVPEGVYAVTASKDGHDAFTRTDVEVTRGNNTLGVDFYLTEKETRVYGIVRSGTLLLVGVNVSVVGTNLFNLSGSDGSYEIRNLTVGMYTLAASAVGYKTMTAANLTITAGAQVQQNFNMEGLPGGILRGKVYIANTQETISNALITIVNLRPQPISRATNIYGEFEFAGLTNGTYTIHIEKTGFRPIEVGDIIVTAGDPVNMTIELVPVREGFEGFFFGYDMAHSMMILALALTIVILAVAVYLRVRTFQTPEASPAIMDEIEEEPAGEATEEGAQTSDKEPES